MRRQSDVSVYPLSQSGCLLSVMLPCLWCLWVFLLGLQTGFPSATSMSQSGKDFKQYVFELVQKELFQKIPYFILLASPFAFLPSTFVYFSLSVCLFLSLALICSCSLAHSHSLSLLFIMRKYRSKHHIIHFIHSPLTVMHKHELISLIIFSTLQYKMCSMIFFITSLKCLLCTANLSYSSYPSKKTSEYCDGGREWYKNLLCMEALGSYSWSLLRRQLKGKVKETEIQKKNKSLLLAAPTKGLREVAERLIQFGRRDVPIPSSWVINIFSKDLFMSDGNCCNKFEGLKVQCRNGKLCSQ